jgi:hypothetical protein
VAKMTEFKAADHVTYDIFAIKRAGRRSWSDKIEGQLWVIFSNAHPSRQVWVRLRKQTCLLKDEPADAFSPSVGYTVAQVSAPHERHRRARLLTPPPCAGVGDAAKRQARGTYFG